MREILIKRSRRDKREFCALVDDDIYEEASKFKWRVTKKVPWNDLDGETFVPIRYNGRQKIFLHHLALPLKPGFKVRHSDGNGLDCRRGNLEYIERSIA